MDELPRLVIQNKWLGFNASLHPAFHEGLIEAWSLFNSDSLALKTVTLLPPLPTLRCPAVAMLSSKTCAELKSDSLLPEEAIATKKFSQKRLTEFSLGRACARDILATLGYADFPVRVGEARQPLWPKGLVGSISHVDEIAVCAVASIQDLAGLGIDIETIATETFDLFEMVTSDAEQNSIIAAPAQCSYLAKLLFSAKEAVFKCQFPLTGKWLEFRDVTLNLDFSQRRFATTLPDRVGTFMVSGLWDINDQYIVSVAWRA